jgi:hypothetical protein
MYFATTTNIPQKTYSFGYRIGILFLLGGLISCQEQHKPSKTIAKTANNLDSGININGFYFQSIFLILQSLSLTGKLFLNIFFFLTNSEATQNVLDKFFVDLKVIYHERFKITNEIRKKRMSTVEKILGRYQYAEYKRIVYYEMWIILENKRNFIQFDTPDADKKIRISEICDFLYLEKDMENYKYLINNKSL